MQCAGFPNHDIETPGNFSRPGKRWIIVLEM